MDHGIKKNKNISSKRVTYSEMDAQIAKAVRSKMSLPSIKIKSQTRSTQLLGRHVQNKVRNHCIVNTLIIGGSNVSEIETKNKHDESMRLYS